MAQTFAYKPLAPERKEFRLLTVSPGDRSPDNVVQCSIKHESLSSGPIPRYETISYCWGNPKLRSQIILNGTVLDVPASTEEALRWLRHPETERMLWIDAVCVNQKDLHERSSQVNLMSETYRGGFRNLVWLGEDDGTALLAFEAVENILQATKAITEDFRIFSAALHDEKIKLAVSFEPEPLHIMFSRPWFQRLWVLQEVTLSRESTCYWGNYSFDFMEIMRVSWWILYKYSSFTRTLAFIAAAHMAAVAFRGLDLSERPIMFLLETSRAFQCSDTRDHFYAILGLIDKKCVGEAHHCLLSPDYYKEASEVFRDATKAAIVQSRDLQVLCLLSSHRSTADTLGKSFSSWAPRLDRPRTRNFALDPLPLWYFTYSADNRESLTALETSAFQDPKMISLRGIHVHDVSNETPLLLTEERIRSSFTELVDDCKMLTFGEDDQAKDGQDMKLLAFTLIAGTSWDGKRVSEADYQDFLRNFEKESSDSPSKDSNDHKRTAADYMRRVRLYSTNRRFFSTASGLIGLGPETMQLGNIVVVLFGGSTPFVLRPCGSYHNLIGQCYLHGIMYGEAVQKHRAERGQDHVFHLL